MSLRAAVDEWLEVVGESPVWAPEAESVRMLAAELDADGGAELWREFRFAVKALREVVGGGGVDEDVRDLLERMGDSGVRDSEDVV